MGFPDDTVEHSFKYTRQAVLCDEKHITSQANPTDVLKNTLIDIHTPDSAPDCFTQ
jgi:hypothetical protein